MVSVGQRHIERHGSGVSCVQHILLCPHCVTVALTLLGDKVNFPNGLG